MPTVYQRRRPDGTKAKIYTADIWIDGKKFPRSTGRKTRRDAEKAAIAIEAELRAQLRRKYDPLTLDTMMGRYWEYTAQALPSAVSVQFHIKRLLEILPRDLPLDHLSNAHVADYVTKRSKALRVSRAKDPRKRKPPKAISPATVNRELDVLQAAYCQARDTWEHPVRPINWGAHRLPLPDRCRNTLTIEESRRAIALAATKGRDLADALELTIYTGMRQNELETLVPARVNLQERFCIVLAKRKAKQGYRERKVFLSTAAVDLLQARIKPGMDPATRLFGDLKNGRKNWEWVRTQIGRPTIRWHDLRHTHATMLAKLTKDPLVVQKQLGHTHITTSMGYIHTADAQAREAVDMLPALRESRKIVSLDASRPDAGTEAAPPSSATIIKPSSEGGA